MQLLERIAAAKKAASPPAKPKRPSEAQNSTPEAGARDVQSPPDLVDGASDGSEETRHVAAVNGVHAHSYESEAKGDDVNGEEQGAETLLVGQEVSESLDDEATSEQPDDESSTPAADPSQAPPTDSPPQAHDASKQNDDVVAVHVEESQVAAMGGADICGNIEEDSKSVVDETGGCFVDKASNVVKSMDEEAVVSSAEKPESSPVSPVKPSNSRREMWIGAGLLACVGVVVIVRILKRAR